MDPWLKPMLATPADAVPVGDYVMEPKLDGWRFIAHHTGRGVLAFGGRNASDYAGKLPYIETELAKCLPADTAVDGELIAVDNSGSGGVQSVMACTGPHIPTVADLPLKLVVFDVLRCDGQDTRGMPWHERRAILEAANFDSLQHVQRIETFASTMRTYQVAVELGFEGVVCKLRESVYVNVRSHSWIKLKATDTVDAIITGFKPGKGSRAGEVGAIEVQLLDEKDRATSVETTASGMVDSVRADMLANPNNWLGQIVEIKHNGIMASGKPRHPRFVRRRDDKSVQPQQPKAAPRPRAQAAGAWMRNYGAMGAPKLEAAMRDFERGHGDALDRVLSKGGDVGANEARCLAECKSRGIR